MNASRIPLLAPSLLRRSLAPLLALASAGAEAGPLLWNDNSLSYLYGQHFKVDGTGDDTQQTLSFEHASGWTWGDIFMFVDNKWSSGLSGADGHSYYGEFSPRLSLGKITDRSLSYGIVKDVLIAATYERGENRNRKYLLGPAVDLVLPGFDRFSLNTYYRKPDGITGKASGQWQINPTWSMTLPVGRSDILFDGYLEWYVNDVGNKGTSNYVARSFHFNPQVKYDVGKALGQQQKRFYAGLEWDYWSNKYGIEDTSGFPTDQNALSLLLKVHF
jgi:nucleoside-specific outer membrane channel protein Tsx